jgi:Na+/melibiose symporter-like transporter
MDDRAYRSAKQVPSTTDQVFIALLWFAFYAQWLSIVPTVVPQQVATILGSKGAIKAGVSGTVLAGGAIMSLLVTPIAGALSDRRRAPGLRRRPFMALGMIGSCLTLALMSRFGAGSSLPLYALVFFNLQFWWNWAAGPYAGLIPDLIPQSGRNTASAWMNVMSVSGTIAGNLVLYLFFRPERPAAAFLALIAIGLACLFLTLWRVGEQPVAGPSPPFRIRSFLASFLVPPRKHPNFHWVLVTRLFSNMGIWSVFTFLLFYLGDVIGVARPEKILPALLVVGALIAIPASFIGGRMAGRHGLVPVVKATSWVMAAAAVSIALIAFAPNLWLIAPIVVAFSACAGAYQTVDWALALAVLPSIEDAGKDMGIWHVSMVLPQVLGPATTGWLISWLASAASGHIAYTAAFGIAAFWFVLAAAFVRCVRLPGPATAATSR